MVRESLFLRFAPAASATAVLGLMVATRTLSSIPRGIAIACLVASWAAGVVFARRDVRAHASVVAGIATVTAAGQTEGGVLYGVACAAFLLVSLSSMRAARGADPASRREGEADPSSSSSRVLFALIGTALCVAAALVAGLPWVAIKVERRVNAMFGGAGGEEATAFSTAMVLGSTRGMLKSDTIVLRIDGERPEYLRGAVYDRYHQRFWTTSPRGGALQKSTIADPAAPVTMSITLARGAPNGGDMRWFLPPDACDLVTSAGSVDVDGFGVARRARGEDPQVIALRTKQCKTPLAKIEPPSALDLEVPAAIVTELGPIAAGWAKAATTDRAKLDALQQELGRFEYSLAVSRDEKLDPIVDFVTVHRAGHCELFAAAMVMLARTQGIPARVVGGYRVTEVNPITGRAVVRDRNAHTWIEAWVDGAWRTWDPTPMSETAGQTGSTLDHLGDVFAAGVDRAAVEAGRLGPLGTGLILGVPLVMFYALRGLGRWIKRFRRRGAHQELQVHGLPLPCFDALTEALTSAGHEREPSEPVEAFARRLATLGTPWASAVSEALLHYAGLRYGGIGDEAAIVRNVDRAARAVRTRA